jgi:hypothetical protein
MCYLLNTFRAFVNLVDCANFASKAWDVWTLNIMRFDFRCFHFRAQWPLSFRSYDMAPSGSRFPCSYTMCRVRFCRPVQKDVRFHVQTSITRVWPSLEATQTRYKSAGKRLLSFEHCQQKVIVVRMTNEQWFPKIVRVDHGKLVFLCAILMRYYESRTSQPLPLTSQQIVVPHLKVYQKVQKSMRSLSVIVDNVLFTRKLIWMRAVSQSCSEGIIIVTVWYIIQAHIRMLA